MNIQLKEGLVFLTDLVGFGRISKELNLDDLAKLTARFAELTVKHVKTAEGTIVKYMGDAALGYFDNADKGVAALRAMRRDIEANLIPGKKSAIRVGAHYGPFAIAVLPPVSRPDIMGETVNIAARVGTGGQNKHRGRLIITPEAFRKLSPESRKQFHKYTEPIVYLGEE